MNLHKGLLIALFAIGAQSANAGILFYDDAQIEEKKSDSYEIDQAAGIVTAEFKHDYNTRQSMLKLEKDVYFASAEASFSIAAFASILAAVDYLLLSEYLHIPWFVDTATGGLTKHSLQHCRDLVSQINTSLLTIPVALLASYCFFYKFNKVINKIKNLPREERVTVAKMVQK